MSRKGERGRRFRDPDGTRAASGPARWRAAGAVMVGITGVLALAWLSPGPTPRAFPPPITGVVVDKTTDARGRARIDLWSRGRDRGYYVRIRASDGREQTVGVDPLPWADLREGDAVSWTAEGGLERGPLAPTSLPAAWPPAPGASWPGGAEAAILPADDATSPNAAPGTPR